MPPVHPGEILRDEMDERGLPADALAGSRKARLDEILPDLPRDRLKELCRVFGLDDSGREKAEFAARLMGHPAPPKGDGRAAPQPAARPICPTAPPKTDGRAAPQPEPAPSPPSIPDTPDLFPKS